jgi:hypothetical protein
LDVGECELTWEEPEDDGGSSLTGWLVNAPLFPPFS